MKNKFLIIFYLALFTDAFADNILIEAKNITLDKNRVTSIFENNVVIKTQDTVINADYVKYNKNTGDLFIKKNITAKDKKNNIIETDYAEYNELNKVFKSKGPTKIITSDNYIINGKDIIVNNFKKFIYSSENSIVTDEDGNQIYLENFEYQTDSNIFKSVGYVKIQDKINNNYEFSQIYIDTKKKEILGTDIKAFMNHDDFKINKKNNPRIFANSIKINEDKSTSFKKSVFTLCGYRKNDKCPPWSIQASKMLHDNKKKTIYYNNAVIKVYDIPIFYFPYLSHPDPTVKRRSGFLTPSFSDTKNLGSSVTMPYFFALNDDKNFTLTSRIFERENPLLVGEYNQALKNANFKADFGFTEGYKKTSAKKKPGDKSHIFTKFVKNFTGSNNSKNTIDLTTQEISDDKYLKLYKIGSNLVKYDTGVLKNTLDFTHEKDDFIFNFNTSIYENLGTGYEDKYEYIFPEVTIDKNLFNNNKFGNLDLQSKLKVRKYDTNKLTNFIINDFNWNSNDFLSETGIRSRILGNLKNINYEAKNIDLYKDAPTSELFGALGLLTELDLQKKEDNSTHILTPKILFRYAPGSMRKEDGDRGYILSPSEAYSMNRVNNINNFETGLTATYGFDYKINGRDKKFDLSVAQVINEKENKKYHSQTSLDEKISDLVGEAKYSFKDNYNLKYKFALDQNYNDFNFNEIGTDMKFGPVNFDFNYLQENKHIGNQDYFKTKIDIDYKESGLLSFETKRNLITNSSEFYNLSYEYINDCLRAGLVYRREFYNDSELEPENSLMFKVTLTPLGTIDTPSFSK